MKNRGLTGRWLLFLGIVAAVVGGFLWSAENKSAHRNDESTELGNVMFGNDVALAKPDHTLAIVFFVSGGAAGLFGMLLIAGEKRDDI